MGIRANKTLSYQRSAICLSVESVKNSVWTSHVVRWLWLPTFFRARRPSGLWPSVTHQRICLVYRFVYTREAAKISLHCWLLCIQIAGYKTEQLVKACQVINETVDVDFVDLNMGCPIDMLFNKVNFQWYSQCASGLYINLFQFRVAVLRCLTLMERCSRCFVVCSTFSILLLL